MRMWHLSESSVGDIVNMWSHVPS